MFNFIKRFLGMQDIFKRSRVDRLLQVSRDRGIVENEFKDWKVSDFFYRDPWFYSVVNCVALSISQLPLGVFIKDERGDRQFIKGNPSIEKFLKRPNPWQTWTDFIYVSFLNLEIHGNLFWEMASSKITGIPEVYVLRSPNMEIQWKPDGDRKYRYTVKSGGRVSDGHVFENNEIVHTKWADPKDDFVGIPPLNSTLYELVISLLARQYNRALLENGARPSGFLMIDEELDEEGIEDTKAVIKEFQQGPNNVGNVWLVEKGQDFKPSSLTPQDLEFQQMLKMAREAILSVMRVPPVMVGVFEFANYANSAIQKRLFWEESLLPRICKFEAAMTQVFERIFAGGDELNAGLITDNVEALRPNQIELSQVTSTLVQSGIITINEARAKFGLTPKPPEVGDVLLTTGAFSLEEALREPEFGELDIEEEIGITPQTAARNGGPRLIEQIQRRLIKHLEG